MGVSAVVSVFPDIVVTRIVIVGPRITVEYRRFSYLAPWPLVLVRGL